MKIKGFTMLELIVVMLLTSILFSLGYMGLILVFKTNRVLTLKASEKIQYLTMKNMLNRNVWKSNTIQIKGSELLFEEDNQNILKVFQYNDAILLQSIDFEEVLVESIDVLSFDQYSGDREGLIEIELKVSKPSGDWQFYLNKMYDAKTKMRWE